MQNDTRAFVYDLIWGRYSRRTLTELLKRMRLQGDERVLDVGCGTGTFEELLAAERPAISTVGVDASKRMLRRARAKLSGSPGVSFVHASAEHLPFEDASFDLVVSASALHFFGGADRAIREMKRILRSDGRLYILDWSRDFATTRARDWILRAADPAHVRCYSSADVERMLGDAGLAVRRMETLRSGTYGLFSVEAGRND